MNALIRRSGFRLIALLATGAMAACAPAVGPYQQQADYAAYACQQGSREACRDYQAIAPAANAEAYQNQQSAAVGTAVTAGVIGAVAGAAIASSARSSRRGAYRDRGYYRSGYDRPRGYYRDRGYYYR